MDIPKSGDKRPIRCPFHHPDRFPSAFLSSSNVFYCSVCTTDGGWTAKRFAEACSLDWSQFRSAAGSPVITPAPRVFSPTDAIKTWSAARARAREDAHADADRDVYDYLASRHLAEAWEFSELGVLGPGMDIPAPTAHWPEEGYCIVVPLFDQAGYIANVQARAIRPREPKTKFPAGSKARGTIFADARARSLLKGCWSGARAAILGEGLTDFLALLPSSPVPVLSAPGTGMAVSAIGPWVKGLTLYLALDRDRAGRSAMRPTAACAYEHGARSVVEIAWPSRCKDACVCLEAIGRADFEAFIRRVVGQAAHG